MKCKTEAIIAYREPGTRDLRVGCYNPYFMPHEIRKAVAARVIKHQIIFYFVPDYIMEKVYMAQSELLDQWKSNPELVDLSRPGNYITLFWERISQIKSVPRDQYTYLINELITDGSSALDMIEEEKHTRESLVSDPSIITAPRFVAMGSYIPDPDYLPLFTNVDHWRSSSNGNMKESISCSPTCSLL